MALKPHLRAKQNNMWPLVVNWLSSPCHRVGGYRRTPSASQEQPGLSWFCGAACLVSRENTFKFDTFQMATIAAVSDSHLSKHMRSSQLNSAIRSEKFVSSKQMISFGIKSSSPSSKEQLVLVKWTQTLRFPSRQNVNLICRTHN